MQYSVPQFVEIEDQIIGPLTLKQFLILLFGGLILFFFYSIFSISLFFFVLALPTGGFFAMLAFGKFNGRPLLSHLPAVWQFFLAPKVRIYTPLAEKPLLVVKKQSVVPEKPVSDHTMVGSRLKRLAYLLDQKTAEEERLIHSGKI